ncbi:amino acid transporter [Thermosporothrix hazakensis]|jgi:amino acid transporter|uniref:Amino acid transporter n=1 Tax=Thermosporothrix hazakensis TaxID=644383 RepID=A0A326U532_THEHA|nr:APC family permease [Thermosporothrix hazakensis]PZW24716.1 amino acid transporter [Thermosporothrix hazakensis]GCE48338.1 D-serine/D-alanine/glycine transporter [Thermosporothrix hazakensis]
MASSEQQTSSVPMAQELRTPPPGQMTATHLRRGNERHLISESYVPQTMPALLGTWDMTTTFLFSTYLISCASVTALNGVISLVYLLLAFLTFYLPSLIATIQLGVLFPYEGSLYNWAYKALGGYGGFFAGFCAWFPGVLISASSVDLIITYIQSMHPGWLLPPWQQGLVICGILLLVGLLSIQRFRIIQNLINLLACLIFCGSILLCVSAVVWLSKGNAPATHFTDLNSWTPRIDTISLFSIMTFAFLGTESPLILAGEMKSHQNIKRHLWLGTGLLITLYLANAVSMLIVQGENGDPTLFAMVRTVDIALGKPFGTLAAICIMGSSLGTVMVYNYMYARLLMVGSIDRLLPLAIGKLNKHRVPANAILFQTCLAILFTAFIFIVAPRLLPHGQRVAFAIQAYHVSQAAATLIWAISTGVLFISLIGNYIRHRALFQQRKVFPTPLIWLSSILGLTSCIVTIVDTLFFSWTPLIKNYQWWYLVGSLTLIFLIFAAVASMLANSEAAWQDIRK